MNFNRLSKVLIVLLILFVGISDLSASVKEAFSTTTLISIQIVRKWAISNNGFGKEIVINPKYRNDASLKQLGEQLRKEAQSSDSVLIVIFDSKIAALQHSSAIGEKLNKKDLSYHDKHFLGSYSKNSSTGYERFQYGLNGFMNDPVVVIKY